MVSARNAFRVCARKKQRPFSRIALETSRKRPCNGPWCGPTGLLVLEYFGSLRVIWREAVVASGGEDRAFQGGKLGQKLLGLGAGVVVAGIGHVFARLLDAPGEIGAVDVADRDRRFGQQRAGL